jgi:hypothetical protein
MPLESVKFDAVICRKCGMRGPLEAWNRRQPSTEVRGPLAIDVYGTPPGPTWDVHNEALSQIGALRRALAGLVKVSWSRSVIVQRAVNHANEIIRSTRPNDLSPENIGDDAHDGEVEGDQV